MTHAGKTEFVIPNHLNLWFHLDKRITFQRNCLAALKGVQVTKYYCSNCPLHELAKAVNFIK